VIQAISTAGDTAISTATHTADIRDLNGAIQAISTTGDTAISTATHTQIYGDLNGEIQAISTAGDSDLSGQTYTDIRRSQRRDTGDLHGRRQRSQRPDIHRYTAISTARYRRSPWPVPQAASRNLNYITILIYLV
jgi:hypothetical protein